MCLSYCHIIEHIGFILVTALYVYFSNWFNCVLTIFHGIEDTVLSLENLPSILEAKGYIVHRPQPKPREVF